MKLKEYLDTYYLFSGKASDIARQLAFAAIALIWVFRYMDGSDQLLPRKLIFASFFVASSLALDLFQYISGAFIWGIFHRIKEKNGINADDDIKAPSWLNKPILFFFILKICFLFLGYIFILIFLGARF